MTKRTPPKAKTVGPPTKTDPLAPGLGLLVKLGSIAVHADEMFSDDGHHFDKVALQQLLVDQEVVAWIAKMTEMAMVPRKRK